MKVTFFHDGPLYKGENGKYYNGVLNDEIIERYFYFCDSLKSVTRVYERAECEESYEIKHSLCEFVSFPNPNDWRHRRKNLRAADEIIERAVAASEFLICRVPSFAGEKAIAYAKKYGKPFLTEVVGCPWDSLRMHSFIGKLLAVSSYLSMHKAVSKAPYVMYVTNRFLQNRYPTTGKGIGCSDVVLQPLREDTLTKRLEKIRSFQNKTDKIVLGTCGVLNVKYKGQEHVFRAMRKLLKKYPNLEYQLVGGGDYSRLETIAKKCGIADHVKFVGGLSHDQVFSWLDDLDVYVQPSDTEGLCRALIEATSRALPCIASNAGGNPELVSDAFVFRKKNAKDFAKVFEKLVSSQETLQNEAKSNFENAKAYEEAKLLQKRHDFYDLMLRDMMK